jgi:hypothetical protein
MISFLLVFRASREKRAEDDVSPSFARISALRAEMRAKKK